MVIQFDWNGTTYRTDGKIIEAKDGNSWNKTGPLEARRLFMAFSQVESVAKENDDANNEHV